MLGWYVLRHVQRVIGASFDETAPLNTILRVRCPSLLLHRRGDATLPAGDATRLLAASSPVRLLLANIALLVHAVRLSAPQTCEPLTRNQQTA